MTTEKIIKNALEFLCVEYGFEFQYETEFNGAMTFKYFNDNGSFSYYQWEQMQEYEFSVIYNQYYKKLEMQLLFPKEFALFNQQHKGLRWLFKDKREDYWNMIAGLIKGEIKNTGSLFGLML